jgi:hypothetical protein
MRIRFKILRARVSLPRILRSDGWALEGGRQDAVVTTHPDAAYAPTARSRLFRLGLLISCCVRIEFLPDGGLREVGRPRATA